MQTERLGLCVICGNRVFSNERYLKSSEGYCHNNCVNEIQIMQA